MHHRLVLVGLCAIGVAAGGAGCDTPCNFRILDRLDSGTGQVGCCGASATQEIVIPDERDLAVDIAQIATSPRTGGQDVYLTGIDCAVLFDAPYPEPGTGPRPVPRCQVLAGPVAPGAVSPRASLRPGRYRAFVQAYAANPSANAYRFEVNVWGTSCGTSPVAP